MKGQRRETYPVSDFDQELVYGVGQILAEISESRASPLRAIRTACLENSPKNRPKFDAVFDEIETLAQELTTKKSSNPKINNLQMKARNRRLNSNFFMTEDADSDAQSVGRLL